MQVLVDHLLEEEVVQIQKDRLTGSQGFVGNLQSFLAEKPRKGPHEVKLVYLRKDSHTRNSAGCSPAGLVDLSADLPDANDTLHAHRQNFLM